VSYNFDIKETVQVTFHKVTMSICSNSCS